MQLPASRQLHAFASLLLRRLYSTLAPENLTTFAHFSVSAVCSFQNSAGVPGIGVPPSSASRSFIFGSASAALISRLSFATISLGVPLGAAMPNQALAS